MRLQLLSDLHLETEVYEPEPAPDAELLVLAGDIDSSWRGLARATVANRTGGMPQGASTITQQVARTFFLSTRRTAERKVKEALLALQLERELTKDQILELYRNQIYLGQRTYGFGAAAPAYFGRPLEQLTLAETALIAGLPQNPIHANPVAGAPPLLTAERIEDPALPTVLLYGHGDVVRGDDGRWRMAVPPGPKPCHPQDWSCRLPKPRNGRGLN